MNMYSDFLKENGIDPADSFAINHSGDAPLYLKHLTETQKNELLEMERTYPEQRKKFNELKEFEKKSDQKKQVKDLLKLFVQSNYPKESFKKVYQDIYDGWVNRMANTMFESAEFAFEDGDIKVKGQKVAKEQQPANELERMLYDAKINLDKREPSISEILESSFVNNGGYHFSA